MNTNLTVRQIAKKTGVSTATVSRVLNNRPGISDEARQAVLSAVNSSGYRNLRGSSSSSILRIAILYAGSGTSVTLRGYDADLATGIYASAGERQAQLSILNLSQKKADETFTQFFLRNHIDGVVLRVFEFSRQVAVQIASEGFPCVVASERYDEEKVSFVDYDSRPGMARAMDHLAEIGHRRIGFASSLCQGDEDTDHRDRRNAYLEGLKRNGLEFDERLILETTSSRQGGASAVDQFIALENPPTAIIFANPPPTIGGIMRALNLGINVPGKLSIVGYDNSDMRHSIHPSYSAVCQDAEKIGYMAASAVLDRIIDRTLSPAHIVVPTFFEANETTSSVEIK